MLGILLWGMPHENFLYFKWTLSQVLRSVRLTTLQPSPVNVLARQTLSKHRANLGLCLGYYCGECLMRALCFKWTLSQVLRSVRLTTLQPSPVNVLARQTFGILWANLILCLGYYCGECPMRIFCILNGHSHKYSGQLG
jgi:hypothetical protein